MENPDSPWLSEVLSNKDDSTSNNGKYLNIPYGQSSAKLSVILLFGHLSLGHCVTRSLGHLLTWSLSHSVTCSLGHYHSITHSLAYLVTFSHLVTRSIGHSLTHSLAYLVTWSLGHSVTRTYTGRYASQTNIYTLHWLINVV